jgi:predicted N-acetyltransferase YhbS
MAGLTPPRPLAAGDDRNAFDCGRESLNQWFWRHAWHNQEASVSRTSVVCDPATGNVVGYVALSAAQIERAHLPKSAQRNRPDPVPALLLGQLAVDRRHQGRGYARSLMLFALTTAVRFAKEIGCFGVLTHPLDDDVRAFYTRFGFETLPFDPTRSMIVRIVDLEHNGFGRSASSGHGDAA